MNRFINIFILILALSVWSCSGTKTEKNPEMAEADDNTAGEMMDTEPEASSSGDLYAIKVLKGDIPSPMKELSSKIGTSDLAIVYGSPSVKGRNLWGELVPYDEVWRTGANENTTFEVSGDVEVGGQALPAGKYGFFTIPGKDEWTLVFNSVSNEWGHYAYDQANDVLRVNVKPQASDEMSETMEFMLSAENTVALHWGNLMVPFTVSAK